jgi:hypothetical protein
MTMSRTSVALKSKSGPGLLSNDVVVTITYTGPCLGLTLNYDTGASNGLLIQNFSLSAPYRVTLVGHPKGTEMWTAGPKTLSVKDATGTVLASRVLTVTQ